LGMDLAGHLFDESMTSIFWIFWCFPMSNFSRQ
jgi:hypothetical protein